MPKIKRLHFKDFNPLRFIAFLPIFLFLMSLLLKDDKNFISIKTHEILTKLCLNSFDFFFFLSSFLLASLALREYKYKTKFSLKQFYIRKVLRLIPLLFIALLFTFYFHDKIVLFLKFSPLESLSIKHYLLGVPNYFSILTQEREANIIVIWMIYMYLQFYFVFGIILKYFKPYLTYISIALIITGVLSRMYHIYNANDYIFDTLSYGVPIGIGTLIATYNRTNKDLQNYFKNISKLRIRYYYVIGLLSIFIIYPIIGNTSLTAFTPIFTSSFFAFIIMEQTFSKHSIYKLRKLKLLARLGKTSYGLLVLTPIIGTIIIMAFESLDKGTDSYLHKLIFIVLTFSITWLISDLCYNSYEKVFNRIKRDFKSV